ncbi:MAG: chorismate mutase [Epulopiscium sp. Nele67-Bin002]|nr:MAG: chorismate mutase [Epulopiscium sp. Nuni2H_MBin001]OON91711.1 MAG: chorismate mutase [Epulopiscium sp. Nele67-Bin001]OON92590.1 MAG: chorismate mutase [Epulopiscium sp. Nele67-Bin002]
MILGFQGVPGSYSEQALLKYFGDEYEKKCYQNFEDVFVALQNEQIKYGVLPIENSTTGSITQNYDLLKKFGYFIVGEVSVKIEHHLLGLKGAKLSQLTHIYSHPQGFDQCSEYLKKLPHCQQVAYHNTAISAKFVHESNSLTNAAIGSKRAAQLYGLEILDSQISNAKENVTRFIVVAKHLENDPSCNKMTLIFNLPDVAGSLLGVLHQFAEESVNLVKIESRPVGDGSFSYYFYVDIIGNKKDENIKRVLEKVKGESENLRILGCYKNNI